MLIRLSKIMQPLMCNSLDVLQIWKLSLTPDSVDDKIMKNNTRQRHACALGGGSPYMGSHKASLP